MLYVPQSNSLYKAMPGTWNRTLAIVQGYFPQAQIAGGALRDLWHDKPVKDVDIFIPVREVNAAQDGWLDYIESILAKVDPYYELVKASVYGQAGNTATPGFRNIYAIYRIHPDGAFSTPFEIIFIEDRGEDVIEVFDLSIAQIGFDGNQIRYTENFFRTVADKIIRVCNVNRSDRQTKRMDRVLSKYPEYRAEE